MKLFHTLCTCLLSSILISHAPALEIKAGTPLNEANQAMTEAGYPETALQEATQSGNTNLAYWETKIGTIRVIYETTSEAQAILSLSIYIPNQPYRHRGDGINFDAQSFNTETGQLLLQLTPPEETQEAG